MTIPDRLQNPRLRFIKVQDNKAPMEKDWQNSNNYVWYDEEFQEYLKKSEKYGVATGFGRLIVIDFDSRDLQKELYSKFPKTFTVKTAGKGLYHLYYFCDEPKSFKLMDLNNQTLMDVQGVGKQAIGPNSKLNNKTYDIIRDEPIASLELAEIERLLAPWLNLAESIKESEETDKDCAKIKKKITIPDLLKEMGIDISKNPTNCPFHDSAGGRCLSYNEEVYHCFHCESKGSVFGLIMEKEKVDFTKAKKYLARKTKVKLRTKKEKEEEKPIQKSLIVEEINQVIYEQVVQDGISKYCKYDCKTGEFEYVDEYKDGETTYIPIVGQEIEIGAVYLPDQPLEYGSDKQLDNEIKEHITKWLDIPKEFTTFALWNIKRSWVYEKFHTLNYLRALGDTGQGKSRFLDTLGYLHYKPIVTSGATTSAAVFRMLQKWRGTLIMDEADFGRSDEAQDIIKIINIGYERGKPLFRCDQVDANKINFFDPYGPKILATRRVFQDKAVESRCMTQVMLGTVRRDIAFNLNKDFFQKTQELRNKLLMWRFRNYFKINQETEYDLNLGRLEPRVIQIITSFVSLFINDTKQLNLFKEFIIDYQDKLIQERQNTFEGEIVGGIYKLIKNGTKDFIIKDIIEEANLVNKNDKPVAIKTVAGIIKSLGLTIGKAKKIDGKTKKCVEFSNVQLLNLFQRYGYPVTQVTVVTQTHQFEYNIEKEILEYKVGFSHSETESEQGGQGNVGNFGNSVTFFENSVLQSSIGNQGVNINWDTVSISYPVVEPTKEKQPKSEPEKKEISGIQNFDNKQINYHKCQVQECQNRECNFDSKGIPYCEKHWDLMAC